jgi:hypothetical protein
MIVYFYILIDNCLVYFVFHDDYTTKNFHLYCNTINAAIMECVNKFFYLLPGIFYFLSFYWVIREEFQTQSDTYRNKFGSGYLKSEDMLTIEEEDYNQESGTDKINFDNDKDISLQSVKHSFSTQSDHNSSVNINNIKEIITEENFLDEDDFDLKLKDEHKHDENNTDFKNFSRQQTEKSIQSKRDKEYKDSFDNNLSKKRSGKTNGTMEIEGKKIASKHRVSMQIQNFLDN